MAALNVSQRAALCGLLAVVASALTSAVAGPLTGLAAGALTLYITFRVILTEQDRELLRAASAIGNAAGRLLP